MGGNRGGGRPHQDLEGGGHSNAPPPPYEFGVPKEDPFLLACSLVREFGDLRGYPYHVSGN